MHTLYSRAGPQNEKWSYQQKPLDPTKSIHKKVRRIKRINPPKIILNRGIAFEKSGPSRLENDVKISTTIKHIMAKNHFSRADLGSWGEKMVP